MEYSNDFEQLWKIYPKRAGGNPKPKAYKAFNARLKEKVLYSDLQAGLLRYYNFCKQTGLLRTSYVMQAATFFSANSESWKEDWEVPAVEVKKNNNGIGAEKGWPPEFDPSRQCNPHESVEACRTRAWRNHERPH